MYTIIQMSNGLLHLESARPFNEFKNSGNFLKCIVLLKVRCKSDSLQTESYMIGCSLGD